MKSLRMKIMEKIKNKEKLSHALPVSLKYGWIQMTLLMPHRTNIKHNLRYKIFYKKNEDQFHVN